eukprot:TRINITY_DN6830_c0_g1_i1.p1 TRINITY_DN6830_c0_g1~~TRINITY_DN6830_c0_g1_i1.p1  ORF type:complete len:140 (-),score=38.44 TRINITY_DN6830_c0_g1_i1:31-450(-)
MDPPAPSQSSSSSSDPSTLSPAIAKPQLKKRQKVPLGPGCSALDWARYSRAPAQLSSQQRDFRGRISLEELASHNTIEDAWTAINGRVFNISPYLKFHPGGADILMTAAGKDGTKLFSYYHSWVNAESLLSSFYVGTLG